LRHVYTAYLAIGAALLLLALMGASQSASVFIQYSILGLFIFGIGLLGLFWSKKPKIKNAKRIKSITSPTSKEKEFIGEYVSDIGVVLQEHFSPPSFNAAGKTFDISANKPAIELIVDEIFSQLQSMDESSAHEYLNNLREKISNELEILPLNYLCGFFIADIILKLEMILPYHLEKYPNDKALFGILSNLMMSFHVSIMPVFSGELPSHLIKCAPNFCKLYCLFRKPK
jgi:hypothetical protein